MKETLYWINTRELNRELCTGLSTLYTTFYGPYELFPAYSKWPCICLKVNMCITCCIMLSFHTSYDLWSSLSPCYLRWLMCDWVMSSLTLTLSSKNRKMKNKLKINWKIKKIIKKNWVYHSQTWQVRQGKPSCLSVPKPTDIL